jgi:hypothetical protein
MVCVVEINWIFKLAFTVVKPFLSKRTLDKVLQLSFILLLFRFNCLIVPRNCINSMMQTN